MMTPLVTAAALMNAAMVSASAMSTIVVAELVGPGAGGLPNTAAVLGTAAGAVLIGRLTQLLGRAAALRTGYAASAAGAALTVASVLSGQLVWLFAGMLLLGAGNAAGLLSRYAAADLVVPSHRARAMGTVVWAGTAGAVVGPLLLEPAQRTAAGLGMPPTVGPFLVAVVATVGAGVAISRFRRPAVDPRPYDAGPVVPNRRTNDLPVPLAGAVMVVAQIVMVAVMTAVPVHAHHHGHGLVLLGVLLSGHTFGMFALSPLTGWFIDRVGSRAVSVAGVLVLVTAAVLVALPIGGGLLAVALFALGYGWNLSYVSGSAALSRAGDTTGAPHRTGLEGPRLESLVEAWAWTASAVATALSTWLFSTGGFPLLAVIGLSLLVPVLVALTARRPTPIPVDGD
ncbi:MAG TPA: MFS transporter [Kribbellaceae bacterium]|nr:MFS transporter [Kribbellaceae bacterium]